MTIAHIIDTRYELDDSGVGITKDAVNDRLWLATRETVQIGESSSFSHDQFVPYF